MSQIFNVGLSFCLMSNNQAEVYMYKDQYMYYCVFHNRCELFHYF